MRIIHLTDAHLSSLARHSWWTLRGKRRLGYLSWWRKRRHELKAQALEQVSAAALALRPDIIAITGDLVHLGLAEEIESAGGWLDALGSQARVVLVPGNHDCYQPDSAAEVVRCWGTHLSLGDAGMAAFPTTFERDGILLVGLSSASPMPFWSAAGRLGAPQLERLDRLLARSSGCFRCILIHHPPMPRTAPARKALQDAAPLADLLERHGVELVLHGHVHRNRELMLGTRTRVLATAAASNTSRAMPAAFRLFDIDGDETGWDVAASLHVRDAAGTLCVAQQTRWRYTR